jgi:hypothetical protein
MKRELVLSNDSGMLMDHKLLHALIDAVRFQLASWDAKTPDEMDEDEFADLQNDIGYLGSVLTQLEDQRDRQAAARAAK